MKSIFKENLGADYVADIISSCNQNGIQAIAEYTNDEILFYDPKNWLYCRHSDLIKDASLDGDIFDLFNNSKPEFRKQVMRPTKGKDFEDFAFEWNALQKEPDNPDIIKTKTCEMIRMDLKESRRAELAPGMDELVVDWYRDAYPTDTEMFADLEAAGSTFADVWNALKGKKDVYAAIGADDSIVRERVFEHLCELTGKKYDTVYNMWLKSADESSYLHDFKPIDSAYLDDDDPDFQLDDDIGWSNDPDNYEYQDRVERKRKRAREQGKKVCFRCGDIFDPKDGGGVTRAGDEFCPGCAIDRKDLMVKMFKEHEEYEDDPNDWSASEGEVEIVWDTSDYFDEFGIDIGDTETLLIDYDRVDTHDMLLEEVVRLIEEEYPGISVDTDDFVIDNEDEFWEQRGGNPGKLDDDLYAEGKRGKGFEVVEDIPVWASNYFLYKDETDLNDVDMSLIFDFVDELKKKGLRLFEPIPGTENKYNDSPAFGYGTSTEDWYARKI